MIHLPPLIQDLALILGAASVVTILFKKVRCPVVLGYILAGLMVGPHVTLFPSVSDVSNIKIWADIGVIFLLFALGLEFSFKKLMRVGGAASITALVEVFAMVIVGFITARLLNLSMMDSLFLGGILAISSTTIIIRAFEENGVKGKRFVNLVFGVLVVEDLVAILLMVLLSTIAASNQFQGKDMAILSLKLGFFLCLWFLLGIFIIPTLLRKLKTFLNEETLLVISCGLCLIMVVSATQAGFSPALGAFIMGSILAETNEAEKIEHLISPLKNLFGAIFFVSVGMLIDPVLLAEYAVPVLVITVITIVGKTISTTGGALLAGQSPKSAVQAGLSMAQIGEFSFIIAGLGQDLKVTSEFLYPVAIGVSAITTLSTPFLINYSEPFYYWIDKKLPSRWKESLARYNEGTRSVSATSEWTSLIKSTFIRIALHGVIVSAIFLLCADYLPLWFGDYLGSARLGRILALILALAASAPFLWALALSRPNNEVIKTLWKNRRNRAPLLALEGTRIIVAIMLLGLLAPNFLSLRSTLVFTIVLTALGLYFFSHYLKDIYSWFERRFIENFSERDPKLDDAQRQGQELMAPWDAHVARFVVGPDSEMMGQTLAQLKVREKYGVTIALIERGTKRIPAPHPNNHLFPFDQVSVIGTDEQLLEFKSEIEAGLEDTLVSHLPRPKVTNQKNSYTLQQINVSEKSPFSGKSIRDSGLRENSDVLVVGIERQGERFLNPDASMEIQVGDLLWAIGNSDQLKKLK